MQEHALAIVADAIRKQARREAQRGDIAPMAGENSSIPVQTAGSTAATRQRAQEFKDAVARYRVD